MSEPNSAYDDILQDLKNALAREQGLLAELRHANGEIARLADKIARHEIELP